MSACARFVDDFGNDVVPCKLGWPTFMARYYFQYGRM